MNSSTEVNALFFYTVGGKQLGPVSREQLRQLAMREELKRSDMIWTTGMKEWRQAADLPGLFDDLPPDLEQGSAGKNVKDLSTMPKSDTTLPTASASPNGAQRDENHSPWPSTVVSSIEPSHCSNSVPLPLHRSRLGRAVISALALAVIIGALCIAGSALKTLMGIQKQSSGAIANLQSSDTAPSSPTSSSPEDIHVEVRQPQIEKLETNSVIALLDLPGQHINSVWFSDPEWRFQGNWRVETSVTITNPVIFPPFKAVTIMWNGATGKITGVFVHLSVTNRPVANLDPYAIACSVVIGERGPPELHSEDATSAIQEWKQDGRGVGVKRRTQAALGHPEIIDYEVVVVDTREM